MWSARKAMSFFLSAAFVFCACFSLTGCGSSPGTQSALDPKKPVTVTLWHYYVGENQQALETAVSEFNQTVGIEKGVIVDTLGMGSIGELEVAVTESAGGVINAKPMPDIFSCYPDKAMEIDSMDMLADLGAYFSEEEKALYVGDFLADGIFPEDRLLLIPIVKSTELMYVNATAWEEFATETGHSAADLATWEGIYETAKAYYRWTDGQTPDTPWDGTALMGIDTVANYVIISCKQLGVNVIHADEDSGGYAVLDEEILHRIFDNYYEGMALGYYAAEGKFRSDDMKAGYLIAYVGSSSSAAYFPTWIEKDNTRSPIQFLPLSYPVFAGGEPYAIQQGAGMCVSKSTPAKQEGAALFLKWFTAAEQNIPFAMTTGYLPVQADAYASTDFDAALASLRSAEEVQQNVAGVYEIALYQITESSTYAAKPFVGSYDVRSVLQSTLLSVAQADKEKALALKAGGITDEGEILAALNPDQRFADWIAAIKSRLDELQIEYVG